MWSLLKACLAIVCRRNLLLVVLNWLFFSGMVVGALLKQAGLIGGYRWPVGDDVFSQGAASLPLLVLSIFVFNLVVSGFVVVTLSGFLFFGLSVVFLLYRAWLWGMLLTGLGTPLFLAALPTLILEGEGYVLAAWVGINMGLSWLKPKWAYRGEDLSWLKSVKRAFKDSLRVYVLVGVFLLVAAIVEVITIFLAF